MSIIYTTKIVTSGPAGIKEACKLIKQGDVVAIPTETVYGLGANALDADAVEKIFNAKGRPSDNPMIVHIHDITQVPRLVKSISDNAKSLMDKFWPGPLTLIMERSDIIPDIVTASLDTVAIRMPDHHIALAILQGCQCPIAAPSANRSGRPSPTNASDVFIDMEARIPLIVDGGPCKIGIESTVVDLSTSDEVVILRPGAITKAMIEEIIPNVRLADNILSSLKDDETPKSPGMKYRHYAPKAKLEIVKGCDVAMSRYICKSMMMDRRNGIKSTVLCYRESARNYGYDRIILGSKFKPSTIAENLFSALRDIDSQGCSVAYIEYIGSDEGINLAIMNRLLKASGHNLTQVD